MGNERPSPSIETFTASDGYRWHYRHYAGVGTFRALIVGLHGIQSHGGWYEHSCRQLAQAGFNIAFLDRRGSGLNQEGRGDAPSFRRLLDDVAEFIKARRDQTSPVFLMAISWGGKLALALPRRHPGLVNGLALLCPGLFPRVRPPFRQRLAIFATRVLGRRRLFPIPLNDPELFTANPRWIQFLRDDPASLHDATARLLVESVRLDGYLHFAACAVDVPVLLMLAGQDRIIDNARTQRFIDALPAMDKSVIEYPQASHTLEFEPHPDRFIADLERWLVQHAAPAIANRGPVP